MCATPSKACKSQQVSAEDLKIFGVVKKVKTEHT